MTTRLEITVRTESLPEHTDAELKEWLRYKLGASSSMSMSNPLEDCELSCSDVRMKP